MFLIQMVYSNRWVSLQGSSSRDTRVVFLSISAFLALFKSASVGDAILDERHFCRQQRIQSHSGNVLQFPNISSEQRVLNLIARDCFIV